MVADDRDVPGTGGASAGGKVWGQGVVHLPLRWGPREAVHLDAVAEQDKRGQGQHGVPGRRRGMGLHVEGTHAQGRALRSEGLDDGGHRLARAAPWRPEVHEDVAAHADDVGIEVGIGQRVDSGRVDQKWISTGMPTVTWS